VSTSPTRQRGIFGPPSLTRRADAAENARGHLEKGAPLALIRAARHHDFAKENVMAILTKPSFAPSTAIIYVTIGALLDVWTAVYYFTFMPDVEPESRQLTMFWLSGLFLTGLALLIVGLALGSIGRSARRAELPPPEAMAAEAKAAASPDVVVAPSPAPAVTVPVQRPVVEKIPTASLADTRRV
jgi:hypothetical protein